MVTFNGEGKMYIVPGHHASTEAQQELGFKN